MTSGGPALSGDTIVAVATPPGVGGIAVVRLSGPDAGAVLRALAPTLRGGDGGLPAPRRATLVRLVDPSSGEPLDQALATWFPAPASFTGEDVVELSCHGGWLAPALVVEACREAGARPAEPGEFTRRAYLHGRMDLVQVEALGDLVEARSRALHGAALHQLERGLSGRIGELRRGVIHLEALLVHHVDFPDEDDAPVPVGEVAAAADRVADELARLLATAPEGELLREGALTVLAGRPNAGKSSLFNALLGQERALVTESPGTTRDALEAVISVDGFPFRLVDTAGLRETAEGVERMGIEVARRYLHDADLVLLCVEAGRRLGDDERAFLAETRAPVVLVRTRGDEAPGEVAGPGDAGRGHRDEPPPLRVSVRSGEGLPELRERLSSLAFGGLRRAGPEAPVLTRRRQARGVERALEEVRAFAAALRAGVPAEVAGAHLRTAEGALEEVVGLVDREEVLDHLFASFCIGK